MSWGTCYQGSNNIHFNYPPLMNDGRNFSLFESSSVLDNAIKTNANIKSNSEYRNYIQKNADLIIKNNQLRSCNECNSCSYLNNNDNNIQMSSKPYIFNNILSKDQPYGYEDSDLKNIYLSREQLNAQKFNHQINLTN